MNKKIIAIILLSLVMQSCGTWKWVEPITPQHANNHRFNNNKICR